MECMSSRFSKERSGSSVAPLRLWATADAKSSAIAALYRCQEHWPGNHRLVGMEYRCVATSPTGFIQQLVSCYLPHGYYFYVSGIIPSGKQPEAIDEKLKARYGIGISRTSRARRKAVGIANVHYIRYRRRFLLLATHGFHPFFEDEARSIRDARHVPIKFEGYSISVARGGFLRKPTEGGSAIRDQKWRVRVQIEAELYKGLKAISRTLPCIGRPANWRPNLPICLSSRMPRCGSNC